MFRYSAAAIAGLAGKLRVGGRWGSRSLAVLAAALGLSLSLALVLSVGSVSADPASDLSEAESRVASAEADVSAAQRQLDRASASYDSAAKRAKQPAEAAQSAQAEVREIRTELAMEQRDARAEIAGLEEARSEEEEERDEAVSLGIGIALASLVAVAIALSWGWFRSSPLVAALVKMQLAQAVAVCAGGGFLLLVVGAALAGAGVAGAIGTALFLLAFILPTALLLGRHSIEVERDQAKPQLGRKRMPEWVPRTAAGLFLLLLVTGLGISLFADEPEAASPSADLRREAEALERGPGAARLSTAKAAAARTRERAANPLAQRASARADLRGAKRGLRGAKADLAAAEGDERRSARRLASAREAGEREAQEEAEREAEEAEEFDEDESAGCEPGYSPCVPSYPPDVDCAEVAGSVTVTGSDPHGLDADGDGVGCE